MKLDGAQLIRIDHKDGKHGGILSATDSRLVEVLTAVLDQRTDYRVIVISKEPVHRDEIPYLAQFHRRDPEPEAEK